MSMYNDYDFPVEEILPSVLPSYSSGRVTASRTFSIPCIHAEEFCLRMIGKFYDITLGGGSGPFTPQIPAPYPFNSGGDTGYGQINIIATSFSIEALSECCFDNTYVLEDETTTASLITDPTSILQQAHFFAILLGEGATNDRCLCKVTINYSENPCDCLAFNNSDQLWEVNEYVLPGTCLSVERNPAYEMLTLPNGNLIWKDLPSSTEDEQIARQLKSDSYAYKIIPKADIIVHWHNVPVRNMCAIENHLREFRGTVNSQPWGDVLQCDAEPEDSAACGCGQYEPETIMFIDYQEDRSQRTDAFGGFSSSGDFSAKNMNTTTLKLIFKQKRIERPTPTASYSDTNPCPDNDDEAYGWNHLFFDRNTEDDSPGEWMRVAVDNATEDPLFPLKNFVDIFYPVL
jgi:hypothetical protein